MMLIDSLIQRLTNNNESALNKECLTLENIGAALSLLNVLSVPFKVQEDVLFFEELLWILYETIRNKSLSDMRYGIER